MILKIYFLSLIALLLFMCSCQQRMYFPDRANVLAFKEKNEAKLDATIKPQVDVNTGNFPHFSPALDAGYAITDHIAVLASYRSEVNRDLLTIPDVLENNIIGGVFNGRRFEIGGGYFSKIGNKGTYEVLAGYGNGYMERMGDSLPQYNYTTRYNRYFVQSAVGFSNNIFSLYGGLRAAFQSYYDFNSSNPNLKYSIAVLANPKDVQKQIFGFMEPYIDMQAGYEYIKFDFQTGFSAQYAGGAICGNTPLFVSLGISFRYAPRFFYPHGILEENR